MIKISTNKPGALYFANPDLIRFRDNLKSLPDYPYHPDTDEFEFANISALVLDLGERAARYAAGFDASELESLQAENKRLQDENTLLTNRLQAANKSLQDANNLKTTREQQYTAQLSEARAQASVPELEFVRIALEKQRNKPVSPAEAFAYLKQLWQAGHPFPKIKTAQ